MTNSYQATSKDSPERIAKRVYGSDSVDLADSHLVLNVLNQIAADDFRSSGTDNPLLFALSGYLQEIFLQINCNDLSLSNEIKILRAYVSLLGVANRRHIDLNVVFRERSCINLPRGWVARIARCMSSAIRPHLAGDWHMQAVLGGDLCSEAIAISVELKGLASHQVADMECARRQFETWCVENAEYLDIRSTQWLQSEPRQLRLICNISARARSLLNSAEV